MIARNGERIDRGQSGPLSVLPRFGHDLLEPFVIERRRSERSNQVGRRSLKSERIGLGDVAPQQCFDVGGMRLQITAEPGEIEVGGVDCLFHALARDSSSGNAHERRMGEFISVLVFGCERELGAMHGRFAEDRPILVNKSNFAIDLDDSIQIGRGLFAVWTVVIEESDNRDIPFWVPANRGSRVVQDVVLGDRGVLGTGLAGPKREATRQCHSKSGHGRASGYERQEELQGSR